MGAPVREARAATGPDGEATAGATAVAARGGIPGMGSVREQLDVAGMGAASTAYSAPPTQEDYYWGRAAAGTEEDYYWRRLSDVAYQKDVLPSTYLEIHNACYEAYNANPLANYIVEITTNFVLGNGVRVAAANKRVQRLIDRFWDDPDNHMATRVYALCTELSLYGEQFIRFFVNPYDGHVKIAQLDPALIDEIEADPDNVERITRIHRRVASCQLSVASGTGETKLDGGTAANTGGNRTATDNWQSTGRLQYAPTDNSGEWLAAPEDVVQVAINKVSNAKRGKSDLATLLPWLRRYKDWLTDRVRINKYKGAFLWTIKLTGADRKTIDRKRMEYAFPPEPGSIVVHNESEEWSAVQPQINADDVEADGRAIKLMIAMGAGLPEHYLSEGGNANRATAAEMGLPTFRKFQRRQDQFALLLRTIVDRVLDEAVRAGTLPAGVDRSYEVLMPELAPDDNTSAATAAGTMAAALATARQQGWISEETAMRLFYASADVEIDVHEERERIAAEKTRAASPQEPSLSAPLPMRGRGE